MNAQARLRREESAAGEPGGADRAGPQLRIAAPAHRGRAPAPGRPRPAGRWITTPRVFFLVTTVLLGWGYSFPTEQYLTPQSGVGYALGIVGGSSMLLLLVYPLRKRIRALSIIGTTKRWFQAHMALGVIGPVLVLFHSNFSLGAANSNVALVCMLVVSGSGLFGRYFYTRIHHGLHGHKASLAELRDYAEKLRWVTTAVDFLPDLVSRIEREEQGIVTRCERTLVLLRPLVGLAGVLVARRRLHRHVGQQVQCLRGSAGDSPDRRRQLRRTAGVYIDDRLAATRRVVEFAAFERLFSLWHALHLPLFLMLLVAGIAHVIAVHVY